MAILDRIACMQGRRDEIPNRELAKELAVAENRDGIRELAENLFNGDKNIQSDCIKVLYEIGYIKPGLVSGYAAEFLKLLKSRNNRMVWGAMIALSAVSSLNADLIFENLQTVYSAMKQGSVITVDNGIRVLAAVASVNPVYNECIFPYLLDHLRHCKPMQVCQHAESVLAAVNTANRDDYERLLREREISLSDTQLARIKKIYKKLDKR